MYRSKYFTDIELRCPCCDRVNMDDDFMKIMDKIREVVDDPMFVSSGFRCPVYNDHIDGHPNSSHMKGKAIDIVRENGVHARKIADAAVRFGINGIEVGTNHIHLDMGGRPKPVIWAGISK